jgi:hypothetical protein
MKNLRALMLAGGLVAMAHVGTGAVEPQHPATTDATQALAARPAAGLVTSPACAGGSVPVAPAQSVVGLSEHGGTEAPLGQVLITSRGPMYRLDVSEPRGTYLKRKGPGFNALPTSMFASNGVQKDSPWYLCTTGADGTWKPDSGAQLSDAIYMIPGDPRHFIPPSDHYYPDTIYTDGYINQFWVEKYDRRSGIWTGDWLFIIEGTSGPVFNTPGGYMVDVMGNATRRYAMAMADYLIIVVYRPDAYKVTATCYAPEIGSVVSWAPPVPTCGKPISNLD